MNTTRRISALMILIGGVGLLLGCSSSRETPALEAYNEALNACQREQGTDRREACFSDAQQKYEAAVRASSSCPKFTC